ncbi:hypothetical protein PIB30_098117, partial [Stylosanthes scabra]|nr:hypothetical protein [Stylosanthes scabra]
TPFYSIHPNPHSPYFCSSHPLNITTQHLNSALPFPSSPLSFIFSASPTFPALTPFSVIFFCNFAELQICLSTSKTSSLVWLIHPSLIMAFSSTYHYDQQLFRAPHHQEIYQKYIHKKGVTPEKNFELQEGQYPEVGKQIQLRGWRRLSKPRMKISKDLVLEFYTDAVRTEEELASGEDYPYTSFVRGTEVDFSAAKIREVLRIRHMTLGAEINFKTRQYEDKRLDEVIRDICMPGA